MTGNTVEQMQRGAAPSASSFHRRVLRALPLSHTAASSPAPSSARPAASGSEAATLTHGWPSASSAATPYRRAAPQLQ